MRSPEALKPRETHRTPNWPGAELSMETIRAYLADLSGRGRRKGTVQMYSAKLRALYDYLPPDKQISRGTLAAWRAFLLEAGYSPSTVNTHLSAANGLMEYMGRRDLQLVGQLEADKGLQPELSRVEYLRLLQAARILEKERTYLLVKIFALAGIRVGELPQVTVERVRAGRLPVRTGGERRYVPLPACLQGELLDYARRQGLTAGPVFCGSCIWLPRRRWSAACACWRSSPTSGCWTRSSWPPGGRREPVIPSIRMFTYKITEI